MPKRIPISAAKSVASQFNCRQVVIFAWDGELYHCVTFGKSVEDCSQAAEAGNRLTTALGWPESHNNREPSRVRDLRQELKSLREENASLKAKIQA